LSLHIIFVAPFGLKHKTTVWARTLPLAQSLIAAGHSATILVPPWDSPEDAEQVEISGGVTIQQLSLAGGLMGTVRRLVHAIDQASPDIVHIVKPRAHAGLVQWWLWQRRHVGQKPKSAPKLVLDVDDWEQAWTPVNRYNWFVGQFLAWQEEWGIRHADGITAASRWLETKAATVAPHISRLYLPNGVNPLSIPSATIPAATPRVETLHPANPLRPPQVLFFTRFIEVSPAWLAEFWTSLHKQMPTVELIIGGTPVQPWLATSFYAALQGMPQVKWLGYVQPEQLPELYANSTCAIFPAEAVPLMQAKCSVRLATTLLHGLPVIASAVGEQANYGAGGAARLVPAGATPVQFAHAVAETIANPAQHATLRTQATERLVTRYAWPLLTRDLITFYKSLLDHSTHQ
jgi:glycosyltransferase involved in cell wall biosynthesis